MTFLLRRAERLAPGDGRALPLVNRMSRNDRPEPVAADSSSRPPERLLASEALCTKALCPNCAARSPSSSTLPQRLSVRGRIRTGLVWAETGSLTPALSFEA